MQNVKTKILNQKENLTIIQQNFCCCCCSDWDIKKLLLEYHMFTLIAFIIFINLPILWNQDNRFSYTKYRTD